MIGLNSIRKSKKQILKFEAVGIILTCWGLFIAFLIDTFGWSAVITTLCFIPITHIIKFLFYRKIFLKKEATK